MREEALCWECVHARADDCFAVKPEDRPWVEKVKTKVCSGSDHDYTVRRVSECTKFDREPARKIIKIKKEDQEKPQGPNILSISKYDIAFLQSLSMNVGKGKLQMDVTLSEDGATIQLQEDSEGIYIFRDVTNNHWRKRCTRKTICKELARKGVILPVRYLVDWNKAQQKWIGQLVQ